MSGPDAMRRGDARLGEAAGGGSVALPGFEAVDALVAEKYGGLPPPGWGPMLRRRWRYHTPDDRYEAAIDALVAAGTRWLDVGCGRELFPSFPALGRRLAARAGELVGIDPDATLDENPYVGVAIRGSVEELPVEAGTFDLVTLRMVAEHVADPVAVAGVLARATRPGGLVVVYTPWRWSPVPLVTALLPFALHQPIKRLLWRTAARDTFPTRFRMNTRRRLRRLFAAHGFDEAAFARLDDCRTTQRWRLLQTVELMAWRLCRACRIPYPEHCLLGIYRRRAAGHGRARADHA